MTKKECLKLHGIWFENPEYASDEIADADFIALIEQFAKGIEKANEEARCDCCGKKVSKWKTMELKLPIVVTDGDERHIGAKDMAICENCCNVFMKAYYTEARNNNYSGWLGVSE